jgi:membrane protein DedA with SNARE-associated domain
MIEPKRKKPFIKKISGWFKKHYLPLLGLLMTIAIIATLSIIYVYNKDVIRDLEKYEYIGVFIISVFLNATIIIPVSAMAIISYMGHILPLPLLVGVVGGIGAGIGEMTGYLAGRSGRGLLSKSNMYNRVEKWVKRWGWIAIFVLSMFPLLFDIAGIIAGAMRMPVWKFFLATWLGRTISYIVVAYLGTFIFSWLG